jgi:hypothetical protein
MTFRRPLLGLASAMLGAVLVVVLLRLGRVNVHATLDQLLHCSRMILLQLLLLNALLVWLSTVKWRSIDAILRRPTEAAPSRITAFFVTSAGMALGLILPVQLGMTVSRTVGTHFYGRAFQRGTGGTLFEQSFDLLITVLLAVASLFTWLCHGQVFIWTLSAVLVTVLGLAAVAPCIRLLQRICNVSAASASLQTSWSRRFLSRQVRHLQNLQHSGLMSGRLGRRLLLLSAARFAVVVLMATRAADAIGVHIVFWRMAAALPFATFANLIAVTPGGVGVNELASVTALHLFGIPLAAASDWALANRLLLTASCFAVLACAFVMMVIPRLTANRVHDPVKAQ